MFLKMGQKNCFQKTCADFPLSLLPPLKGQSKSDPLLHWSWWCFVLCSLATMMITFALQFFAGGNHRGGDANDAENTIGRANGMRSSLFAAPVTSKSHSPAPGRRERGGRSRSRPARVVSVEPVAAVTDAPRKTPRPRRRFFG